MATILDVAREAGVGIGTVSRVLNNHPRVAPATRERVEEAIERLGYRPNPMARGLSTGHSSTVSMLVPALTSASVVARLRGILTVLNDQRRDATLIAVDDPEQRDRVLASIVGENRPAGLIVMSLVLAAPVLEDVARAGVPTVFVDTAVTGHDCFHIDNEAGGRLAAEHLVSLGHERFAFVGDPDDLPLGFDSGRRRLAGFRAGLAAAGHELPSNRVELGPFGEQFAAEATRRLLGAPDPPTAIFAASDTQAMGVLEAARQEGIDVPGDLSVIGFDDVEVSRYTGLTTIRQPLEASGRMAAERLVSLMNHPGEPGPVDVLLDVELVVRRTTGATARV